MWIHSIEDAFKEEYIKYPHSFRHNKKHLFEEILMRESSRQNSMYDDEYNMYKLYRMDDTQYIMSSKVELFI